MAEVAASDFPTAFGTSGFDDINFFTNAINTTTQGLDIVVAYKKIIELDPNNRDYQVNLAKVYSNLGLVYYNKSQYEKSITNYNK